MAAPWYDEITNTMNSWDIKCQLNGPMYEYNRELNRRNPYSYGSAEEFKKVVGKRFEDALERKEKGSKKACVVRAAVSPSMDKYNRLYKNARNKSECEGKLRGVWDPASLNRADRYRRGVCWADKESAACGEGVDDALVLGSGAGVAGTEALARSKESCTAQPGCKWVPMSKGRKDCFKASAVPAAGPAASAAQAPAGPVMNPPADMPLDVTRADADIGTYMKNWYSSATSPAVSALEGKGNRCRAPKGKAGEGEAGSGAEVNKRPEEYTLDELKAMPIPLSPENRRVFVAWYGELRVQRLEGGVEYRLGKIKAENNIWQEIPFYWSEAEIEYPKSADELAAVAAAASVKKSGFLPSVSQSVINMIMKNIAMHAESTNKGMMAWHSTGSGKTCTAAGVMDAFWDSDKQIVFASSIDAIASNPDYKFHECAVRLFPRFLEAPFDGDMATVGAAFEERGIIFVSFAKLANRIQKTEEFKRALGLGSGKGKAKGKGRKKVQEEDREEEEEEEEKEDEEDDGKKKKGRGRGRGQKKSKAKRGGGSGNGNPFLNRIARWYGLEDDLERVKNALRQANIAGVQDFVDLDHAVLIIDEVHNLFRPLAAQKEKHAFVEKHIVDATRHPDLKVVILTATPGDNVRDVIKLMNIVRDPTKPAFVAPDPDSPQDIQRFKESVRGIVSYFEMSGDRTKFPVVRDHGPVKYPMSATQFARYMDAYKETKDAAKNYDKLAAGNELHKFWASARKYSNMLYNLEKGMALTEFSSKLPPLLDKIREYPADKHYVYSAFYERRGSSQGILAIAAELEKMGYEKLTVAAAKAANRAEAGGGMGLKPRKRYMLAIQSEIGEEGSTSAGRALGEMINIYNSAANKSGDLVHVFLASQKYNEGLDLKAVKHIHIFEPLVTMASDIQTIGRARRNCSHADLEMDEWTVDIHRYLTDLPIDVRMTPGQGKTQERLAKIKAEVVVLEERIKETDEKTAKKILKETVAQYKKEIKGIEADAKKLAKADTSKINSIDMAVYTEAQNRMRELFVIYHCLKEAAIDCQLLHAFHGDATIQCLG